MELKINFSCNNPLLYALKINLKTMVLVMMQKVNQGPTLSSQMNLPFLMPSFPPHTVNNKLIL